MELNYGTQTALAPAAASARGPHSLAHPAGEAAPDSVCGGAVPGGGRQVAGTQEAALVERVCVAPRLSPVRLACAIKTQFVIQSLAEKQLDITVCLVSFSFSSTIPISLTFCCSAGITPAQSTQCTHKSSAQALQSHRSTHRSTAWPVVPAFRDSGTDIQALSASSPTLSLCSSQQGSTCSVLPTF